MTDRTNRTLTREQHDSDDRRIFVGLDVKDGRVDAAVCKENADGTISLIEYGHRILPSTKRAKTLGEL